MNITVTDICSSNTKLYKMEDDKNIQQNLDNSNDKLHISDVIRSYRILKVWWWKQRKLWTDMYDWNRENGYW